MSSNFEPKQQKTPLTSAQVNKMDSSAQVEPSSDSQSETTDQNSQDDVQPDQDDASSTANSQPIRRGDEEP